MLAIVSLRSKRLKGEEIKNSFLSVPYFFCERRRNLQAWQQFLRFSNTVAKLPDRQQLGYATREGARRRNGIAIDACRTLRQCRLNNLSLLERAITRTSLLLKTTMSLPSGGGWKSVHTNRGSCCSPQGTSAGGS